MAPSDGTVRITRDALERVQAQARSQQPLECCGLLAGRQGVISIVLPARNALASASSYEIGPAELFTLFRKIRAEGWEHLGIYHSHPHSENHPSASDIEQSYYPEAAYLIVSLLPDAVRPVRAFQIRDGRAIELTIQVV